MPTRAKGDCTNNKSSHQRCGRLFPLPYLNPICESPSSPSARIRYQIKWKKIHLGVTNRCIHSINTMYSNHHLSPFQSSFLSSPPSPAASLPAASPMYYSSPSFSSNHPRQPDNHSFSFFSSIHDNSHAPYVVYTFNAHTSSPHSTSSSVLHATPSVPSKSQQRLLHHIEQQCAAFIRDVRSVSGTNSITDNDMRTLVYELLNSFRLSDMPTELHIKYCLPNNYYIKKQHNNHISHMMPVHVTPAASTVLIAADNHTPSILHSAADTLPPSSPYASSAATVVPLCASRVALPDQLNIVPLLSVLPPSVAASYSPGTMSAALLRHPTEVLVLSSCTKSSIPRIAGSRSQYVKLLSRMHQQSMITFTAHPMTVNGIFTVLKDETSDRLIIDAQPANMCFIDSPHVSLPDPSHLVKLQVPKGEQVYIGKSDLSNYYHHLGLPAWMQPYFCLPALTKDEIHQLGLPPSTVPLYPMCTTLPMGFSHAVYLANTVHEHILYSFNAVSPCNNILSLHQPLITHHTVVHGIVIDDFFLFSLSKSLATVSFRRVLAAYRQAGFIVKDSKAVAPTTQAIKIIGFQLCGADSTICLSPESRIGLLSATYSLLSRPTVTGLQLAHLIGRWTWCLLVRRSCLSVIQHCYKYIQVANKKPFTLWPSVRRELCALVGLLPLMSARFDTDIFNLVVASDASTVAAGVVVSPLTYALHSTLWPICSTRAHAALQAIVNAHATVVCDLTVPPASQSNYLQQLAIHSYQQYYTAISASPWSTIISKRWLDCTEHINLLELRAVLLSLHWLLTYPSSHLSRVYFLVDSLVAFFTLWKGRSSSGRLLCVLRKINALLLASGVSLLVGWVPSAVNPADAPSRLNHTIQQ